MMFPFPFMMPPFGMNMPPQQPVDNFKKQKEQRKPGGAPFYPKPRRKEITRELIEEGCKLKGIEKIPMGVQVFLSSELSFRDADKPLMLNLYRKSLTDLWKAAKESKNKSVCKQIAKHLDEIAKNKKSKKPQDQSKGNLQQESTSDTPKPSIFDQNFVAENLEDKELIFRMNKKPELLEAVKRAKELIMNASE